MRKFRKIRCRLYQGIMRLALPFLPYKNPVILDEITNIDKIIMENDKHHPLIVCGPNIYKRGMTKSLEESLVNKQIKYTVFNDIVSNPTVRNVLAGAKCYQDNQCDCIIAFGGGSPMDCAKIIGAKVSNPNKQINEFKGLLKIKKKIPLLIAIPTTAGTGSETTVAAVIVDEEKHYKYSINDFKLIPTYAVLDSSVLDNLPPKLIAETGMDAMTHALEAYIGKSLTRVSKKESMEAIQLIFDNLKLAYNGYKNAKKAMLLASFKAGRAFTRSYVGYVHALAHPLGGKYNLGHGLANAILLPYVLRAYGTSISSKMKKLAIYLGLADNTSNKNECTRMILEKLGSLEDYLQIPKKVEVLQEKDIKELAILADKEANPLYPVPKLMDSQELEKIYYEVLK